MEYVFNPVLKLGCLLVHIAASNYENFVHKLIPLAIRHCFFQRTKQHCILLFVYVQLLVLAVSGVTAEHDVDSSRQWLFIDAFPGFPAHDDRVLFQTIFVVESFSDAAEKLQVFGKLPGKTIYLSKLIQWLLLLAPMTLFAAEA
jgi:hypothetical protein